MYFKLRQDKVLCGASDTRHWFPYFRCRPKSYFICRVFTTLNKSHSLLVICATTTEAKFNESLKHWFRKYPPPRGTGEVRLKENVFFAC
jgi:hypothetical protein